MFNQVIIMRTMEFTIEDNWNMLEIGQEVNIIESKLPTSYYYTIERALGMSKNYSNKERLKIMHGIVKEKNHTEKFNVAVLEFDE